MTDRYTVESPTIAERDSDGAFPTEFPVRWAQRGDAFEGYFPHDKRAARYALFAAVIIVAIIAAVVRFAPVTR